MAKTLYITYDGLTDPLGRSQVLPYLAGLSRLGHQITILSCEKLARLQSDGEKISRICAEAGLDWHPLRYHAKPPIITSLYDTRALSRESEQLHRREPFDIVHCRSYIPAIAGRRLQRRCGVRFLFDMRGFWPEEKVEGGNWPQSNPAFRAVYRYFKNKEADFLAYADHVICLTHEAEREMVSRPDGLIGSERITVIPCCVDFLHFSQPATDARAAARRELGLPEGAKVLVYLGSLGGNYMLGELLDFFLAFREAHPGALFLFVTQNEAEPIRAAGAQKGIGGEELVVRPASREEVPIFVSAGDVGIAFKQPVFSSKGCSPTKLGEMLALGLPVVANDGVGDVGEVLSDTGVGVIVEDFNSGSYRRAAAALQKVDASPAEIRRRALPWFDVEIGIGRYDEVYRSLADQPGSNPREVKTASNGARKAAAE